MRRSRVTALVLGVLLIAARVASDQTPSNGDAARLQGSWEIVSVQRDGSADLLPVGSTLVFSGDEVRFEWRVLNLDKTIAYPIPIDAKAIERMAFS
jgi:hypothetical protein